MRLSATGSWPVSSDAALMETVSQELAEHLCPDCKGGIPRSASQARVPLVVVDIEDDRAAGGTATVTDSTAMLGAGVPRYARRLRGCLHNRAGHTDAPKSARGSESEA